MAASMHALRKDNLKKLTTCMRVLGKDKLTACMRALGEDNLKKLTTCMCALGRTT